MYYLLCLWLVGGVHAGWAYPSAERTSLSLGLQAPTGLQIDNDNHLVYVTAGTSFQVMDLGTFALTTSAFDLTSDKTLNASIQGIAFDALNNKLFATQDGGLLLTYKLSALTDKPTQATIASGKAVTRIVVDPVSGLPYMLNTTDLSVLTYNPATGAVATLALPKTSGSSYTVLDMILVRNASGTSSVLYLTTNDGQLFFFVAGATAVNTLVLDAKKTDDLTAIAAHPNSSKIYVANTSQKLVHVVSTATNTQSTTISLAQNADLESIVVTDVTNPSDTYGFVVGSKGLSVFDADSFTVLDLGSKSDVKEEPLTLAGSGALVTSDDGYLFNFFGNVGVISDNPFVTVNSVAYSSGKTALASGETVAISFQADEAGSYDLRIGGTVEKTGASLKDTAGASTGTVSAAKTAQTVTIAYSGNSTLWSEGNNTVFFFVKDSAGNEGRRATTISVDTPPPTVEMTSAGFGNQKLYVNVKRLAVADISSYRIYADTDATAVTTKPAVAGSTSQTSAGTDPTVTITGLSNGTSYFLAAEAVDTKGNVSPTRTTTFTSGAVASSTPEGTFGPAGLAGEAGCTLVVRRLEPVVSEATISTATAEHWTLEMRGGIYQPTGTAMKNFFSGCCNPTANLSGGYQISPQFGVEVGAGYFLQSGGARGNLSGATAQERFTLWLVPMQLEGVYRAVYRDAQLFVPFVKAGGDVIYFHEFDDTVTIKGVKGGLHAGGGLMLLLNNFLEGGLGDEYGINDIYVVIDGRYQWVNNFGGGGLDLSGWSATGGFQLQF